MARQIGSCECNTLGALGNCFHGPCAVVMILENHRVLLRNSIGWVRLFDPAEVVDK